METSRFLVCALWLLAACSAPSDGPPPAFVPEDPDAILIAVTHYFADSTEAPIALADTSFRPFLTSDGRLNPDSVFAYYEFGDSALLATYFNDIRPGYPLPMLERDDVFRSGDSPRSEPVDYDTLPKGRFLGLMRPAVAADSSEAVMEYVLNCNSVLRGICGHGGILFLRRLGDTWVVVVDERTWVS